MGTQLGLKGFVLDGSSSTNAPAIFQPVGARTATEDITFQFFTAVYGPISASGGNCALKRTSFLNNNAIVGGPVSCMGATMTLDEVGWLACRLGRV